MNERIRLLAEQAGLNIPADAEYNGHIYKNAIERFAGLIVVECIRVVDKDGGATHVRELLEEHFGVE
jgi:hypothetical protein